MNTTVLSTYASVLSPLKGGRHEMRNRIMGSMHT